jgi:rhodanese-related sulfurtransferase
MKRILLIWLCALTAGWAATTAFGAEGENKPAAAAEKARGVKNVDPTAFEKLRADKKNVLLDVRTAGEYSLGHIPGAVNIDFTGPDFAKNVASLDKSKTYLVYCASGGRSAGACKEMAKLKFAGLVNLEGGYRGWVKAGNKGEN